MRKVTRTQFEEEDDDMVRKMILITYIRITQKSARPKGS